MFWQRELVRRKQKWAWCGIWTCWHARRVSSFFTCFNIKRALYAKHILRTHPDSWFQTWCMRGVLAIHWPGGLLPLIVSVLSSLLGQFFKECNGFHTRYEHTSNDLKCFVQSEQDLELTDISKCQRVQFAPWTPGITATGSAWNVQRFHKERLKGSNSDSECSTIICDLQYEWNLEKPEITLFQLHGQSPTYKEAGWERLPSQVPWEIAVVFFHTMRKVRKTTLNDSPEPLGKHRSAPLPSACRSREMPGVWKKADSKLLGAAHPPSGNLT